MDVALDLDGVIADFVSGLIVLLKRTRSWSVDPCSIRTHELALALGITFDERSEIVKEVLGTQDLEPYDGAVVGMKELAKDHRTFIITARHKDYKERTERWLKVHGVPFDGILWAKENMKFKLIKGLDVCVDDNIEEIIKSVGVVRHPIVFSRPWNMSNDLSGSYKRVESWPRLVDVIKDLENL